MCCSPVCLLLCNLPYYVKWIDADEGQRRRDERKFQVKLQLLNDDNVTETMSCLCRKIRLSSVATLNYFLTGIFFFSSLLTCCFHALRQHRDIGNEVFLWIAFVPMFIFGLYGLKFKNSLCLVITSLYYYVLWIVFALYLGFGLLKEYNTKIFKGRSVKPLYYALYPKLDTIHVKIVLFSTLGFFVLFFLSAGIYTIKYATWLEKNKLVVSENEEEAIGQLIEMAPMTDRRGNRVIVV